MGGGQDVLLAQLRPGLDQHFPDVNAHGAQLLAQPAVAARTDLPHAGPALGLREDVQRQPHVVGQGVGRGAILAQKDAVVRADGAVALFAARRLLPGPCLVRGRGTRRRGGQRPSRPGGGLLFPLPVPGLQKPLHRGHIVQGPGHILYHASPFPSGKDIAALEGHSIPRGNVDHVKIPAQIRRRGTGKGKADAVFGNGIRRLALEQFVRHKVADALAESIRWLQEGNFVCFCGHAHGKGAAGQVAPHHNDSLVLGRGVVAAAPGAAMGHSRPLQLPEGNGRLSHMLPAGGHARGRAQGGDDPREQHRRGVYPPGSSKIAPVQLLNKVPGVQMKRAGIGAGRAFPLQAPVHGDGLAFHIFPSLFLSL